MFSCDLIQSFAFFYFRVATIEDGILEKKYFIIQTLHEEYMIAIFSSVIYYINHSTSVCIKFEIEQYYFSRHKNQHSNIPSTVMC